MPAEATNRSGAFATAHAALAKAGRVMAQRCRDASVEHERVLLGDISKQDQLVLKELLDCVYENARKGFTE